MTEQKSKRIVVVLGAGRCGTSLLMQVLSALGMNLSNNLVQPKVHNTLGPMEDATLAAIYDKEILHKVGTNRLLPFNYNNFSSELQEIVRKKFVKIININAEDKNRIWGFKDPFTAFILPLWFRVFNSTTTTPIFLLAVRNPAFSVMSRRKHFGRSEYIGELAWLANYVAALHYSAADCFIVHYEDWFTRPIEQAQGLLQYTGLDEYFTGNVEDALKDVIKPNLNRAVYEDYEVKNEYVLKLYDVLKDCRGHDFDRQKLMSVVKECRKAMDGFKGWYMEAQNQIAQKAQLQNKLGKGQNRGELEKDLHDIILQNNAFLEQIKDLSDKKEELRVRLSSAQHELAEIKKHHKSTPDEYPRQRHNTADKKGSALNASQKWQKEAHELRNSTPFRLGNVIVLAITKPGKNTLFMPYRFFKIIGEVAMKKIRLKRSRARSKHE